MCSFKILIIEDNKADVFMITEALESSSLTYDQDVVTDGQAALDYFFLKANSPKKNVPDFILLDLNIPKYSGFEILKILKSNHELKAIPIIVFTGSVAQTDVQKSYRNYANCYIQKPDEAQDFIEAIAKIEGFWLKFANLPKS